MPKPNEPKEHFFRPEDYEPRSLHGRQYFSHDEFTYHGDERGRQLSERSKALQSPEYEYEQDLFGVDAYSDLFRNPPHHWGFFQRERTLTPDYTGIGPRNYQRSDARISDDLHMRLTRHPHIDATDIDVHVKGGDIVLHGFVADRRSKRLAGDVAETIPGVKDVWNKIIVEEKKSLP